MPMTPWKKAIVATAATVAGLGLATTGVVLVSGGHTDAGATAVINAAKPNMPADQAPVQITPGVVHPGQTVQVRVDHGAQALNFVASTAFRGSEHAFGGPQIEATVISDHNGVAIARAVISNVRPGNYLVTTRIGGGAGPTAPFTVAG